MYKSGEGPFRSFQKKKCPARLRGNALIYAEQICKLISWLVNGKNFFQRCNVNMVESTCCQVDP